MFLSSYLNNGRSAAVHGTVCRLAVLLLAVLLAACAGNRSSRATADAPAADNHPLTGRIWDVRTASFIDQAALIRRAAVADYVLMGEKHDNPTHHRLQAELLSALLADGRRPVIAFEMLSSDQQPAVERYLASRPSNAAGLGPAVSWTMSGWPAWELYQPIADAAVRAGAPIIAANLAPNEVRQVLGGGFAALGSERVQRLGLERVPNRQQVEGLTEEIRQSHCGEVPEAALSRMVRVQQARDAVMAEALVSQGRRRGGVLIAGAGHVRNDRGVPIWLHAAEPGAWVISIAFREVQPGSLDPARMDLPFDYVWFTPRVDSSDPCAPLRRGDPAAGG